MALAQLRNSYDIKNSFIGTPITFRFADWLVCLWRDADIRIYIGNDFSCHRCELERYLQLKKIQIHELLG